MEFDVFLSHNSKNKPAVRELAKRLTERGIRVWLDEEQLRPGLNWQTLLAEAIDKSMTGAVLVGQDGLGPWEEEEMQALLVLAVRHKRPVIPVLLPSAPEKPTLPLFLQSRTWVDLRQGYSDQGMDRLVWGITGKRTDTQSGGEDRGPDDRRLSKVRRNLAFSLVFLVCAALVALYLPKLLSTEDKRSFNVWIVTEQENTLKPRLVTLPLGELTRDHSPGAFLLRIGTAVAAHSKDEQLRVFRLEDGVEINAGKGEPFASDNSGVLVVPAALVAPFRDAREAFSYMRGLLPKH